MRKIDTLALTLTVLVLCGCGNWLSVQPQGEVIPKTDEEFAAIIHNRLRDIEGGEDEFVIGNMDVIARTEGYADNLDANIPATPMRSSTLKNLCGPLCSFSNPLQIIPRNTRTAALMKIFLYICHLVLPIFTCLA